MNSRGLTWTLAAILVSGITAAQEGARGAPRALADRFTQLDRNRDGAVTPDELRLPELFKRLDANGDGRITLEEAQRSFRGLGLLAAARSGAASQPDRASKPSAASSPTSAAKPLTLCYEEAAGADPNLTSLDVYAPAEAKNCPVMIMIHGGGWRGGDKRAFAPMAGYFTGQGYVFVSINYRLAPKVQFPTYIEDVAKAVAWTHSHIAQYSGDPHRLSVMGHSAGGHLAGLVATDGSYLKAEGEDLTILTRAILLDAAAYDIPRYVNELGGERGMRSLYELAFGKDPKVWVAASPQAHVAAGSGIPPFLVFYSTGRMTAETLAPAFVESLRTAGVPARAVDLKTKSHAAIARDVGKDGDEETRLIMDFLKDPAAVCGEGANAPDDSK